MVHAPTYLLVVSLAIDGYSHGLSVATGPTGELPVTHRVPLARYGAIEGALRVRHPTNNRHPKVPIPEGRHSVVLRRSNTHAKMRLWLTLANHTNAVQQME
jgi:hypothetical protein